MKTLRKWLLILGLVGPTATNFSCSGTFIEELKTSAISGAAGFVEQAIFDILDQALNPRAADE